MNRGIFEDQFVAAFRGEEPSPLPNWVEWKHISQGLSHCPVCLKLDKCWFMDENKPLLPQHPNCHCTVEPISLSTVVNEAKAECGIRKFSDYIFNPKYDYKGKRVLFEAWGYSKMDSELLQKEFERQALGKYVAGEYELDVLNEHGQRISIQIQLKRRDKDGTVTLTSGWMVYPDGKLQLTTPYANK